MRVTLESTDRIVELEGADGGCMRARIWEGETENGAHLFAYVALVAVHNDAGPEVHERFLQDLQEHRAPSEIVAGLSPRQVL